MVLNFETTKKLLIVFVMGVFIFCPMFSIAAERAPDFSLKTFDGKTYSLSDFMGKVIVLNFWASWCRECLIEMPELQELHERYSGKGLVVLGVSVDRDKTKAIETLRKLGITYINLHDQDGRVFVEKYTVIGLPATFVIDSRGNIVSRLIGRQSILSPQFIGLIEEQLVEVNK